MKVLLKISGEVLAWKQWFWFDFKIIDEVCETIKELMKNDIWVWVVVWAWNIVRWAEIASNIDRCVADNMWMLAININVLLLADILKSKNINTKIMGAFAIDWIMERFNKLKTIKALESGKVILFWWWTWNPYFTTDTAWVLRALEIEANMMIKATKVDGVYDKDPMKNEDAVFMKKITYKEVVQKNLKVMDSTAFAMAKDNDLVVKVVLFKKWVILKAVKWEDIGTTISN